MAKSKDNETTKETKQDTKETQEKEPIKNPDAFEFVKKTRKQGLYINAMPVRVLAGERVTDHSLRYEMRKQGIEFCETQAECEFTQRLG